MNTQNDHNQDSVLGGFSPIKPSEESHVRKIVKYTILVLALLLVASYGHSRLASPVVPSPSPTPTVEQLIKERTDRFAQEAMGEKGKSDLARQENEQVILHAANRDAALSAAQVFVQNQQRLLEEIRSLKNTGKLPPSPASQPTEEYPNPSTQPQNGNSQGFLPDNLVKESLENALK